MASPQVMKQKGIVGVQVGSILGERYEVRMEGGTGRYGKIFKAMDFENREEVVIKVSFRGRPVTSGVAPSSSDGRGASKICSNLESEYWALKQMEGYPGFPRVFELDTFGPDSYLVMEKLERQLMKLFLDATVLKMTMADLLLVMDQMLTRLKALHGAGMVHGDVKPENMMMGTRAKGTVYLIDFGLVTTYGGNAVPNLNQQSYGGTPRYMSIRCHEGLPRAPRDDLEGLAYSLAIFLCYKNVPWRLEKDRNKVLEMKKKITGKELFAGQPKEFVDFYNAVLDLRDGEEFNYDEFQKMFRKYGKKFGICYDFDWPFWG